MEEREREWGERESEGRERGRNRYNKIGGRCNQINGSICGNFIGN